MAYTFDAREQYLIGTNSLERVIKTTQGLLHAAELAMPKDHSRYSDLVYAIEDWSDLGMLAAKVWDAKRNDFVKENG